MIRIISILYFTVGGVNAISQLMGWTEVNQYSKPLLMPLLIYYLFLFSKGVITPPRLLLAAALIFSWLGDLALMKPNEELYFLLGLGAFLIAHVLFSVSLFKSSFQKIVFDYKPLMPLILYGGLLLFALIRKSGDLSFAVSVYALCILTMVSIARLRRWGTNTESYKLAFTGAFLFVVSDSLLALNKFVFEIPASGFLVMATYIAAQYLLVKGILNHPA